MTSEYSRLLALLTEPSEEMIDVGRAATAAHLNIEGSALTVAREKMRRRFKAMIDFALQKTAAVDEGPPASAEEGR